MSPAEFIAHHTKNGWTFRADGCAMRVTPPTPGDLTQTMRRILGLMKPGILATLAGLDWTINDQLAWMIDHPEVLREVNAWELLAAFVPSTYGEDA